MKILVTMFICLMVSFSVFAQNGNFEINGMDQQGQYNVAASLKGVLENHVNSSAGLAIGTSSAAKVLVGNTTEYVIDGIFYSKAPAEIAFTATTHNIVAPAGSTKEAYYVLSINAAGTVTITKGATAGEGYGELPLFANLPTDCAILGYVKLVVNAGQTFTAATTELSNSTVLKSATYVNTSFLKKYIGPKSPRITVDFNQK